MKNSKLLRINILHRGRTVFEYKLSPDEWLKLVNDKSSDIYKFINSGTNIYATQIEWIEVGKNYWNVNSVEDFNLLMAVKYSYTIK